MAMPEFLRNVQTARNVALFNVAVSPPDDLARLKRAREVWLSPRVVADYNPADFGFLPPEKLTALTAAVVAYRETAAGATGREPTDDEVRRALGSLLLIVGFLGDDLLDAEGKTLLAAVVAANAKEPFPDFVLGLDATLDADWTGDPGIWIWVIIPDDLDTDSEEFRSFSDRLQKSVWPAMTRARSERWPYPRFRLVSEVFVGAEESAA